MSQRRRNSFDAIFELIEVSKSRRRHRRKECSQVG
ncbi:unnamed protein product [Acanthoscelides obtectus]|uniref:Uncharacterized protein n=1 Tax=Acanthoscelides obtectus TaxID=200917 RepID=A0A9P0ML83_ACAOB|nr:unnamed protein product [Acanthoscelides obtectus]CAK1627654.1 hypothetical protein AOBTE_LOCUS4735 [Acanthoscelides obtectus]